LNAFLIELFSNPNTIQFNPLFNKPNAAKYDPNMVTIRLSDIKYAFRMVKTVNGAQQNAKTPKTNILILVFFIFLNVNES
jgi:hypothetical protein